MFKGAYPEIIDKYMDKIPKSKAFGDALAVLINEKKQENKNGEQEKKTNKTTK